MVVSLCPYCFERPADSDDHIFLQAIGGIKTIRSCTLCNNSFGHTFEARSVSGVFHPIIVALRGAGVDAIDYGAKWKNATTDNDGLQYDFKVGPAGYELESQKPIVRRHRENKNLFEVVVGDDSVGKKHLQRFLRKGTFRVLETERLPANLSEPVLEFEVGSDLKRAALKIAIATATLFFPSEVAGFLSARLELQNAGSSTAPAGVAIDLRPHEILDNHREPLNHLVYVEQSDQLLHAFVQFFGSIQLWIELTNATKAKYEMAALGSLDPLTGVETFCQIAPLQISPWQPGLADASVTLTKLNRNALQRGAKTNEIFKAKANKADGVELQSRGAYSAFSWTGFVPKPKK